MVISTAEPGFVASTLASLAELGTGALMPTSWLPMRLSLPLLLMGGAMSMPWCVCISRSREATIQERKVSGLGEGCGSENDTGQRGIHDFSSDDDANEMDDLLADLEGGERASERAPLLGVGLGGQASRHRRWQPPLIRQQAGGLGSTAVAAVAKDPVARQGAAASDGGDAARAYRGGGGHLRLTLRGGPGARSLPARALAVRHPLPGTGHSTASIGGRTRSGV